MKRYLLLIYIFSFTKLLAEYSYTVADIMPPIKKRMISGGSWSKGCPVQLADLRYIRVSYYDFNGDTKMGELVVHRSVSKDITTIFGELYAIGYPIRKMQLVSDFGGNDWRSIEADNTSAFNCRRATGSKKWSKHAYGKAIDINPIENPYISRSGKISHKASYRYKSRNMDHNLDTESRSVLLDGDRATQIFKKYGWRWGGDWSSVKDYQHFFKP